MTTNLPKYNSCAGCENGPKLTRLIWMVSMSDNTKSSRPMS